jgi:uncharacterized protein YkwD
MTRPALRPFALILAGCATAAAAPEPEPVAVPVQAPEARPAPRAAPASAPSEAARELLAAHNAYRAKHCAAPLAWSDALEKVAQGWADHLHGKCTMKHSGGQYGENLWMGTAGAFSIRSVVDSWYGEVSSYAYQPGGFSMSTGHFTQVVWQGSTKLGCAMTTCNGTDIWVCNYDPPGNYEGEFGRNVLPTSCHR